jgi:hypothetical protein
MLFANGHEGQIMHLEKLYSEEKSKVFIVIPIYN